MNSKIQLFLIVLVGVVSFFIGSDYGQGKCQELAILKQQHIEVVQETISSLSDASDTEQATCEQIFEIVRAELDRQHFLDSEALSEVGND